MKIEFNYGTNKLAVVKAVKKVLNLSLQEAKDVYDTAFMFKMIDGKIKEPCDYFEDMPLDKFVDILHRYEHFWEIND